MASKGENRGVVANGSKIKELRKLRGMSQKGLKAASNLSESTLKRAEQGARVMPEVLAELAKCLKVRIEDISHSTDKTVGETPTSARPGFQLVRLQQITSAQDIAKRTSSYPDGTKFEVLLDLNEGLAEKVAKAIEAIEGLSMNEGAAAHIRRLGKLNTLVQDLAANGAFIFVGGYYERSISSEEGEYEDARWTTYKAYEKAIALIEFSSEDVRHQKREIRIAMSLDEQFELMNRYKAAGNQIDWGNVIPF